jgi:hypothetical protein
VLRWLSQLRGSWILCNTRRRIELPICEETALGTYEWVCIEAVGYWPDAGISAKSHADCHAVAVDGRAGGQGISAGN